MGLILALINFARVTFWRLVLALRGGGRIGRGCKFQPGVVLASARGRPIILGDNVQLMRGVVLSTSQSGKIVLGDNVYIGEYGVVTSNAEINIERDTIIAPHVDLVDFNHGTDDLETTVLHQPVDAAPIRIGRDVWLGAKVTVVRGVTIGDQAVVGTGSVVNRDVRSRGVAVGTPARIIRTRGPADKPADADDNEGSRSS
ncbi:MAG: acyltransferase [Planctomycetes bacterium]|nr:acyltransferase [Planctomycetota bacterium]